MLGGRGKNTKVFYYINDHLGTPQELVSPSGEIVWSAVYHAYGQQAFTLANHIPQPLRFQGQYHDEESGLSYNRYRYYDVSALRYLSPDPIGLAGGVNAYAYVPSPLSWVDPLGLSCKSIQPGDKTPEGRTFTIHGAEQATSRGFSSKNIDEIISNNKKSRVKEIDPATGQIQWRYQDTRGNTVITDEFSERIVTVYSHPINANNSKYIPKLRMR